METYIEESLDAGFIHPSAFPSGTGFFFVERRTKPCACASTTEVSTTSQ
jgi:hypothetical protein